jgi:hypothetical protein
VQVGCACATVSHMPTRIHLVLNERERDAFQARARLEGESLSEWLRKAARERLVRDQPKRIATVDDLDRFFAERSEREVGREPDWDEHLDVAARSRSGGLAAT